MNEKQEEKRKKILKALKSEQEVVINKCWGGFGLSLKAVKRYAELSGFKVYIYKNNGILKFQGKKEEYERVDDINGEIDKDRIQLYYYLKKDFGKIVDDLTNDSTLWFHEYDIKRDDEILIQVIKELGKEANGEHSDLNIVKIPSNVEWEIDDYDGMETIHEKHREWN